MGRIGPTKAAPALTLRAAPAAASPFLDGIRRFTQPVQKRWPDGLSSIHQAIETLPGRSSDRTASLFERIEPRLQDGKLSFWN